MKDLITFICVTVAGTYVFLIVASALDALFRLP